MMTRVFNKCFVAAAMVLSGCIFSTSSVNAQEPESVTNSVEIKAKDTLPLLSFAKDFRVAVKVAEYAQEKGLEEKEFQKYIENHCLKNSLPLSDDSDQEGKLRPVLLVRVNAIPITQGGREVGIFACNSQVRFLQFGSDNKSVGTWETDSFLFIGVTADGDMTNFNKQIVQTGIKQFATAWRECHK